MSIHVRPRLKTVVPWWLNFGVQCLAFRERLSPSDLPSGPLEFLSVAVTVTSRLGVLVSTGPQGNKETQINTSL